MSKTKKVILIFAATIIFVCVSLIVYKSTNPVALVPQPSLGTGVYNLEGLGFEGGISEELIWSPNGKYLAGTFKVVPIPDFICIGCKKPHSELFVIDLSEMKKRTILWSDDFEKLGGATSWFPDGEHIAYSDAGYNSDWGIRSIGVDGKDDVQFMADNGHPIWNPANSTIAIEKLMGQVGGWHPVINLFDPSTGKNVLIFKGDLTSVIYSPSWSADGKKLAFSYVENFLDDKPKGDIYFWDSETNQVTQFTDDEYDYWAASFSPVNNLIILKRENPNSHDLKTIIRDLNNTCEVELPVPYVYSASWSPDGQKFVIAGNREAYIVNLAEYFGTKFTETGSVCP